MFLLELFRMHGTRVLQESEQIKTRFWIGAGDHLITMHTMTPAELNLTEGISRTLTTQIVEYITREDARNRTNANENTRKRRETAQAAIDQHKRMTAGLHFAVGNTSLGPTLLPTLLAHMRETHWRHQILRNQKEKKQMKDSLQWKPRFSN